MCCRRRKIHKKCILTYLILGMLVLVGGCQRDVKREEGQTAKKIAILGKEEYVHADEGFLNGVEMALEEQTSSELQLVYYDDHGDYENGLSMASQIAQDDQVVAVFSFQDFEVVDAEAECLEEAKKPLFAVQGCYEKTLERGYDYVFSNYMSSKDMGIAMAKYCGEKGYKRVVCSHTDTVFENDEIKGFCAQAAEEGVEIVDMKAGPNNRNELEVSYERWKQLGVDAIYICRYVENVEQKEWIFQMIQYIKERDPNFLIMGDYSLNGAKYLEVYGQYMTNAAYPNPYPIVEGDKAKEFEKKYLEKYSADTLSDGSYQGYDMCKMVCTAEEKGESVKDFFKETDGYDGVSGKIAYTEDGKIQTVCEYYSVVDGIFVEE